MKRRPYNSSMEPTAAPLPAMGRLAVDEGARGGSSPGSLGGLVSGCQGSVLELGYAGRKRACGELAYSG